MSWSIKLAITQKDDIASLRNQRLDPLQQGQVAFCHFTPYNVPVNNRQDEPGNNGQDVPGVNSQDVPV
jgi:hypothetical protein